MYLVDTDTDDRDMACSKVRAGDPGETGGETSARHYLPAKPQT